MTQQFATPPAACVGLLIGVAGSIRRTPVALQFPSNARWRAIQSCRDLPQRFTGLATPGNLAALFNIKVTKAFSHDNTPSTGCCISFVNSGNPAFMKQPAVYILASGWHGTLYVGVTSDLVKRVWEHKTHAVDGFTKKYDVLNLV
jgi:hypothetical protein